MQVTGYAQEVSISNTTWTTCGGFIVATEASSTTYSSNEDVSMCVCPGDTSEFLTLEATLLSLGAGDVLTIADGCDPAGELLLQWMGDDALSTTQQKAVSSAPGGCLNVHFQSDEVENGNFILSAGCASLCESVVVDCQFEGGATACLGDELIWTVEWNEVTGVTYEVSTWFWNGDELVDESDETLIRLAEQPGVTTAGVWLNGVTEAGDGCAVWQSCPTSGFVAAAPTIELALGDIVACEGTAVSFDATAFSSADPVDFQWSAGGMPIPDCPFPCAEIPGISQGWPGLLVSNAEEDILGISVNMEHSFMGDLNISVTCPNGQSMTLHAPSGSGTNLGEPVEDYLTPELPGVGYDYTWSPSATNGTWAEHAGGTLPAGTYEANGLWSALNGCPVSGTWELKICDTWESDNGFVFDWSVDFSQVEVEDLFGYVAYEVGSSCDSIHWVSPSGMEFCNGLDVSLVESGVYALEVLDSWGCTSTEEIEITVNPSGCMDPLALNFDAEAMCEDSTCIYMLPDCEFLGHPDWALHDVGWHEADTVFLSLGAYADFSRVFNAPAELEDVDLTVVISSISSALEGEVPGVALAGESELTPGGQTCFQWTGVPIAPGTFDVVLNVEPYFQVFGVEYPGPVSAWPIAVVVLDVAGLVEGCTYPMASNYLESANLDDGSCLFEGCTDSEAANYAPLANVDDGSCLLQVDCAMDGNLDGIVSTTDLLLLLSEFGTDCQ